MKNVIQILSVAVVVGLIAPVASAQIITGHYPVEGLKYSVASPVMQQPSTVQQPEVIYPQGNVVYPQDGVYPQGSPAPIVVQRFVQPRVVYRPVVPAPMFVQPSGVTAYRPFLDPRVTTAYRPVVVPRTVYYATPHYAAPRATTVYRPYRAYRSYPAAYPAIIVRPKVYVRGQPIRNALRAITP